MIYAANLKCNHTKKSYEIYANELSNALISNSDSVIVFPPFTALTQNKFKFTQGAQNFYPAPNGSFTGEIGSDMLDELDITMVMIGHSERRALGEDEPFLRAKFDYAQSKGWDIIYCIGEDDITHMNGSTKEFLSDQLSNINLNYENLVIAYEPIWAIGTGKTATADQANEVCSAIRDCLRELYGARAARAITIQYGGSMNAKNAAELLSKPDVDGGLIGGASLKAPDFFAIIEAAQDPVPAAE